MQTMPIARPWSRLRILGTVVLLSLVPDIALKSPSNIEETMWACYWVSFFVSIGIFFGIDWLVSSGVVFFAGLGFPVWLLGIVISGQTMAVSVVMHTIPLLAGLYYISASGWARLPEYSAIGAWILYLVPFGISWQICSPQAMINLSHAARHPVAGLVLTPYQFYGILMIATLSAVIAASCTINYALARNPVSHRRLFWKPKASNASTYSSDNWLTKCRDRGH
jgi:hypothetical protein